DLVPVDLVPVDLVPVDLVPVDLPRVALRRADMRYADFAARLAIVTDAFPRRVIAGPPRAVLAPPFSHCPVFGRARRGLFSAAGPLLRSISLHVSNRGAFRTRRMPLPAKIVPFE